MKKIFFILLLLPLFLLSSCKGECDFKITFFNVGKADAILIQDKNTNIIIDTGTEESCDYFLEGLKKLNIKEIDCLILSHFDQDHVGGASRLLNTYSVKQIYQTYLVKTSKEIAAYQNALKEKNITPLEVRENLSFTINDTSFTIYPPLYTSYDNSPSNNSSLCVRAVYKNTSYLFPGDAEKLRIKELNKLDLKSDLLKIPHHGGAEDNSDKFIQKISPKYAIITDTENEPADEIVLSYLDKINASVYHTYKGDIHVESDGNSIYITQ